MLSTCSAGKWVNHDLLGKILVCNHALERMVERVGSVEDGIAHLKASTRMLSYEEMSARFTMTPDYPTSGVTDGEYIFLVKVGSKVTAPQFRRGQRSHISTVVSV